MILSDAVGIRTVIAGDKDEKTVGEVSQGLSRGATLGVDIWIADSPSLVRDEDTMEKAEVTA